MWCLDDRSFLRPVFAGRTAHRSQGKRQRPSNAVRSLVYEPLDLLDKYSTFRHNSIEPTNRPVKSMYGIAFIIEHKGMLANTNQVGA
jgi:hypothetical protein